MVKIVAPEDAEKADYVVCCRLGSPTPFTDNRYGRCAHCGHGIFFRPYMPVRPPKICIQCFFDLQKGGHA